MDIGNKFKELIGTEVEISGHVFSRKKLIEKPQTFMCLDVRIGSSVIMNMKTMEDKCYTVELLLKNDSMKKAQWSKPFPDYENPVKEE